jgi:hypothetical protein
MKNEPDVFAALGDDAKKTFCEACEDAMFEMATANMRLMDVFNDIGEKEFSEPVKTAIRRWAESYNSALEKGRRRSEAIIGRYGKTMN